MHTAPYTLSLSVWVPVGPERSWTLCPTLGGFMSEELVHSCKELRQVLAAQGRMVARLLSAPGVPRYNGFRVLGRRKDQAVLVGGVEWTRSAETHELVWYPLLWTSCEYVHPDAQALVA